MPKNRREPNGKYASTKTLVQKGMNPQLDINIYLGNKINTKCFYLYFIIIHSRFLIFWHPYFFQKEMIIKTIVIIYFSTLYMRVRRNPE